MLQITPKPLSVDSINKLTKKQNEINKLASYQERCENAVVSWNPSGKTFDEVKKNLKEVYDSQLCHYCEKIEGSDIEHIFPKSLFPNKTFVWENYVWSCNICNRHYKHDHFAIFDNGNILDITPSKNHSYIEPINENNVFIDLRNENPMNYLEIDLEDGCIYRVKRGIRKGSMEFEKANYTLKILGLSPNTDKKYREALRQQRESAYEDYCQILERYKNTQIAETEEELLNCTPRSQQNETRTVLSYSSFEKAKRDRLDNLLKSIETNKKQRHPSIWEEMKRQKDNIPYLKELFSEIPTSIYS